MQSWNGLDIGKLETDGITLVGNLFNSGITKFLDSGNRPILYGTQGGDTLVASDIGILTHPLLVSHVDNGVVLIGGGGNDVINGEDHNDKLLGGTGNDTLVGGADDGTADLAQITGGDTLQGGAGDDTYSFTFRSDEQYPYDGRDIIIDGEGEDTLLFDNIAMQGSFAPLFLHKQVALSPTAYA